MTLFLTVLEIVAPVFLLASLGFAWVRMGFDYPVEFITRLAMTLAVPCLVFTALMRTELSPTALREMAVAAVLAYAGLTVVFFAVVRLLRLDLRSFLAPLMFGNTGNLGLPLALFAFGELGLAYAVTYFAVGVIWQFTFGLWVVSGQSNPLRTLKEPMVLSAVLGGIFLWQGWETPRPLTNALELLGQMAIPMMLLTLGVAIARITPGNVRQAVGLSLLRVALCAGLGFGIGVTLGLDPVPLGVLVLQVSTPVAVTSYLLSQRYDRSPEAIAGLVVVSTLMSVGTLPLILALVL